MDDSYITVIRWNDIRDEVANVNPYLTNLIDDLNLNASHDFIKVKYGYGQHIIKNGRLQLPISKSELVSIEDNRVPNVIKKKLDYSTAPAGLPLNKSIEVFYESPSRVMPTKLLQEGAMFNLWEIFDPPPDENIESVWNIVSGARTSFMLPKISNQTSHNQLQKKFKINSHPTGNLLNHHHIFSEIANSINIEDRWTTEVIFFSKGWLPKFADKNIKELHLFWLQEAWRQSYNCRNNMSFDMAWELFSHAVTQRNIKPKPVIINTLKHLMLLQEGVYPGFAPAINNDCFPVDLIKKAYSEIYKVKSQPIIMVPTHISKKDHPVYYSLQLPTLIEHAPGGHGKNIITDFRELKLLMNMLLDSIKVKGEFRFFHTEEDALLDIKSTELIPEFDKNIHNARKNEKEFAANSPFLKGCIQISLEKNRITPLISEPFFET